MSSADGSVSTLHAVGANIPKQPSAFVETLGVSGCGGDVGVTCGLVRASGELEFGQIVHIVK